MISLVQKFCCTPLLRSTIRQYALQAWAGHCRDCRAGFKRGILTVELPRQMNFFVIAILGAIASIAVFMVNLKTSVEGVKAHPAPIAKSGVMGEKRQLKGT